MFYLKLIFQKVLPSNTTVPYIFVQSNDQIESGENMIFLKYIFDFVFHWKGIYYGQLYYKTCLGILISPPKPQKTAKNVDF